MIHAVALIHAVVSTLLLAVFREILPLLLGHDHDLDFCVKLRKFPRLSKKNIVRFFMCVFHFYFLKDKNFVRVMLVMFKPDAAVLPTAEHEPQAH